MLAGNGLHKETFIRTNIIGGNSKFASLAALHTKADGLNNLNKFAGDRTALIRKKSRRIRFSAIASYLAIVILIISILSIGYQPPVQEVPGGSLSRAALIADKPSVDQVAAAEAAAHVAQAADLSVASNVVNLSISLNAKSQLAQTDSTSLSKPQLVQASGGHGINSYVAQKGDTVQSVARKFGVSEDSVRWSNNLDSDALAKGKHLFIPGTSGIVYVVKDGDTAKSIAERYRADTDRIITYNDAELTGLQSGQRIVIPDGVLPAQSTATATPVFGSFSQLASSVGNRYDYGYCTWYAYERRAEMGRPVGSFWGNATSWAYFASLAGYRVDHTPSVGAVMQSSGGWGGLGHVAVVEQVFKNGSIKISEMNYAGWNVISYRTISAAEARAYNYIH